MNAEFIRIASREMAPGCDCSDDCHRTLHNSKFALVLLVLRRIVRGILRWVNNSLTYVYINLSLKYNKWEKEQEAKTKDKKESKKQK